MTRYDRILMESMYLATIRIVNENIIQFICRISSFRRCIISRLNFVLKF